MPLVSGALYLAIGLSQVMGGLLPAADCNGNGADDRQEIVAGMTQDCNGNGVPDECEFTSVRDGWISTAMAILIWPEQEGFSAREFISSSTRVTAVSLLRPFGLKPLGLPSRSRPWIWTRTDI